MKTGRNEPCPCGSGKKTKRCCGVEAWKTHPECELCKLAAQSGFETHEVAMPDGMPLVLTVLPNAKGRA